MLQIDVFQMKTRAAAPVFFLITFIQLQKIA